MNLDDFDLHSRLSKLEKQNRRMKQFGSVVLAVVAAIAIMGQAQAKKAIEANEFVLRDGGGNVRAKLPMEVPAGAAPGYPGSPQLVLIDDKGKQRVKLDGGTIGGLNLYDEQERSRGSFTETDLFGSGALLLMQDEHGLLRTRLKEGEVWGVDRVISNQMHVEDADGFAATLGVANLVTTRTGEKHTTSAASLTMFDKDNNVIWKAP
jgi:hypothetical protein